MKSLIRNMVLAFTMAVGMATAAQSAPDITEGDFVVRDFQFRSGETLPELPAPEGDLDALVAQAPPMPGLEYLTAAALADWWRNLDILVAQYFRPASPVNPDRLGHCVPAFP